MGTFTNFPYGTSSFGIPQIGPGASVGPVSIPSANGRAIFVDDGGSGVADGTISNPYKTITLALATAQAGDTIYVFPGTYDEAVVVSKDFITIAGAQFAGYARPDIVPTTGVALTVNAQGFQAKHCRFSVTQTTVDVVVQTGNGFSYTDCVFDGIAAMGATKGLFRLLPSNTLTGQTASEGVIQGCLFRGSTAKGLIFDTSTLNGGSTDNLINGNTFTQNSNADMESAKTGAAGTYSVQFLVVSNNVFEDKNKATYVDLTTNEDGAAANQKGMFANNFFAANTLNSTSIKATGTGFAFVVTWGTGTAPVVGTTFAA